MSNKKSSYDSRYLREYRRNNPGKQEQWRISSEIRHLEQNGYIVTRKQPEQMSVKELENKIDQMQTQKQENSRKWRDQNREHIREYYRQYRKEHPEKCKISPEKRREYAARWRAKHREEIRQYQREWNSTHIDQVKEAQAKWRAKNPNYEALRWQRYKKALEQAKREQQARIQAEIREKKKRGVSDT